MNRATGGHVVIAVLIALAVSAPAVLRAEPTQIIVMVENASIRSEPDMASEVIGSPQFGSVLESEKKVGDWYEVEYTSRVGVLVTGYIHEMFVEEGKEVPKQAHEPEMSTFGVEARAGISYFTGVAGLELRVGQFALDVGYLVAHQNGPTGGFRYYFRSSPDSWFIGPIVSYLRSKGYDVEENILGIAAGRGWTWGSSWGLSVALGIANRWKTEYTPEDEIHEETLWPVGEISLRIRF